ncbi:MAG: hypothetical protein M1819_003137 [Sarea resinae]|nr:MAG: hypothetical protein M1819_003137 [Sarea resinae]
MPGTALASVAAAPPPPPLDGLSASDNSEAQHEQHSPSPPPPAPIAQSPGPRATALTNLFNSALSHVLKQCSYENFAACFPTPAKRVPEALKGMWRAMTGRFEELAKAEFEDILTERAVIANLNELDRLISDASRRKARSAASTSTSENSADAPVAPHLLPPPTHYHAHLAPFLSQHQSLLNAKLQTVQSQNAALLSSIETQRREIEALVAGVEGVVRDLEGAAAAMVDGVVVPGEEEEEKEGGKRIGLEIEALEIDGDILRAAGPGGRGAG